MSSKDRPVGGLDLILGVGGNLGEHVAGTMDEAALPQAMVKDPLGRPDEPLGAVGDDQQRCPQPTGDQPGQEVRPGIMALGTAGGQPDQHRLAVGGDAPGDQDRFGVGAVVHLEVRAVQEQVLQLDVGQAAMGPCWNSSLICSQTRLTVDFDSAASGPSASASDASTSRTDRPRTNPAMTSDSSALVRVTCCRAAARRTPGRCRAAWGVPAPPARRWS
jgi:hypothetical protein